MLIYILQSNRPDLNKASSKDNILFVAAITTIFSFYLNPSISVNSYAKIFLLNSIQKF